MQLKVAGVAEVSEPPRPAEDVEILAPNHKYTSAFPKRTAYALLIAVVISAPAEYIPFGSLIQFFFWPVALYGGVRLGAWVEQSLYARFYRHNFFLRVFMLSLFAIGFAATTVPLGALLLKATMMQPLGTAVVAGGAWGSIAALGSLVILGIDVLASATSKSFRVRVAMAGLGLISVAGIFSFGLAMLGVEIAKQAPNMDPKSINIDVVHGDDLVKLQNWLVSVFTDPVFAVLVMYLLAGVLLFPAVISATVKFADAVMDRMYPMTDAFAKVGEGSRKVRLEEAGANDFVELARSFNRMVARLGLAERMERAFGVYVSGHVMEKIKAQHGEAILPASLKDATVFFADIRGFTSFSEKLPPEALISVLNRYFEQAVTVIEQHEGYLNKFIGDAIVVVFNGPIDQQDHAERAVKCAIALQQKVAELNAKGLFPEIGELKVGVGVSTGAMTCGNIGSARQMEYTVIGDTVNLAARLTSHAGPSEVWISETTAKALPASYGAAALPPIRVKGKEAEVTPWRVGTESSAPAAAVA